MDQPKPKRVLKYTAVKTLITSILIANGRPSTDTHDVFTMMKKIYRDHQLDMVDKELTKLTTAERRSCVANAAPSYLTHITKTFIKSMYALL